MATPKGLRVGDADREAVAAGLREHFAAGRLTMDEFQQRLDQAFAAKTDLDLHQITKDLPAIGPGYGGQPAWQQPSLPSWPGPRPDPGYRPRSGLGPGGFFLVWLMLLLVLMPFLLLSRFLFPAPVLVIFAIIMVVRRILRRAGRSGSWRGPRGPRGPGRCGGRRW